METRICRLTDSDSPASTQSNQNCEVKNLRNISVQTGEEFLDEFLRDRVASRRVPVVNDNEQIQTSIPGYDVVKNLRDTWKRDSESCPDYICFSSGEGDANFKYVNGSSAYFKELQGSGLHHRKFSENLDRGSSLAYSSDSPRSNQWSSKGSGAAEGSFSGKLKFLCSFGGKILPRPNDGKLRYVGGDTRIISLGKDVTYLELLTKTMAVCKYPHTIKYQLPGEDLDALVSVSSDEDLHHMIEEYHDLEKISQRLRLFLVASGDIEGLYSSEGRATQQSDADSAYVEAVNSPQRSFSRDSLESQWLNNIDSPTLQTDSPAPFRGLENQNGSSSLNSTWTVPGPSNQILNTPQVPQTTYVPSSPLSVVQFTDTNASYMKRYEDVQSSYAYPNNFAYIMESSAQDNPSLFYTSTLIDSSNQNSHVAQGHASPMAVLHFQPPPSHAPRFADASLGFPNVPPHSEKLVSSQDNYCYSPATGVSATSYWIETNLMPESQPANQESASIPLEPEVEKISWVRAAERSPALEMPGSSLQVVEKQKARANQVFRETVNLNKDFIEWGEDTATPMKYPEASVHLDRETCNIENNFALNANYMEHNNLPQIICRPDSQLSIHASKSELQMNGSKKSSSSFSSAEYPADFWKDLSGNCQIGRKEPEFLIKSQKENCDLNHLAPHATGCNTAIFGSHELRPVSTNGNIQSQFGNPVFLPDNSSAGLCLKDSLIFPQITARAGEVSYQKEMVENPYEKLMTTSHGSTEKEIFDRSTLEGLNIRNGAFVNTQYPNNCQKPGIMNVFVEVEDGVPSSTSTAQRPDENFEVVESAGDTPEAESHPSDCNDYVWHS